MELKTKTINKDSLMTVTNFAKLVKNQKGGVGVKSQYIYKLKNKDKLDWLIIDGVTFIVLNRRAKLFI